MSAIHVATPIFTVFTATYNRARTLPRLFDSLQGQSFKSFEWLVIDDGSTDDTKQFIEGCRDRALFPIRYERQTNLGKHVAFDRAVDLANGSLFLPVDSDDAIAPAALERLFELWSELPPSIGARYSGLTAGCMNEAGIPVNAPLPRNPLDCSPQEAVFRWGIRGERFGFQRTDVLRKIRFSATTELKFLPEGALWFAIGREFLTRFVDEPLRYYFTGGDDRLTLMPSRKKAGGYGYFYGEVLRHEARYATVDPMSFFKAATQFVRFRHHVPPSLQVRPDQFPAIARILIALVTPGGLALRALDAVGSTVQLRSKNSSEKAA